MDRHHAVAGCFMWSIASAVRYLFPPGVARRPQHGHGRLCGASLHSWLKRLCCCHCLMPSVHSGMETERQMKERERKGSNCGTEKEKRSGSIVDDYYMDVFVPSSFGLKAKRWQGRGSLKEKAGVCVFMRCILSGTMEPFSSSRRQQTTADVISSAEAP
ncbi:hypothetical protein NQZ68_001877 [Dissostichus eleginoides]|nr:hypothetical protein NQZ68_001877 [Dissostichus eleginoides]